MAEASVVLEEVNRSWGQRRCVSRPDVHHGHSTPPWVEEQSAIYWFGVCPSLNKNTAT